MKNQKENEDEEKNSWRKEEKRRMAQRERKKKKEENYAYINSSCTVAAPTSTLAPITLPKQSDSSNSSMTAPNP